MPKPSAFPRGEIVVGANEGTCLHILPEVFAQFKRDYPNVAVSIKRSDYARILESILENAVDFGVVSLPVNDNRLEAQMIHRDHLVAITAPKHPLAAQEVSHRRRNRRLSACPAEARPHARRARCAVL